MNSGIRAVKLPAVAVYGINFDRERPGKHTIQPLEGIKSCMTDKGQLLVCHLSWEGRARLMKRSL